MATQPDNWWESAPVVAPANDPGFSGYIPGAPDPTKELQRKSLELDIQKKEKELNPAASPVGDPSTWDAPTTAMVKALAEGRKAFPSGSALRAPYWQDMLARVSEYDPGFDETNYTSRAATRKDFSIGTAGKNIRALNTAIGHLGQLYGQIGGTASHGLVPLNVAENAFDKNVLGQSGPTNYASTVSALSGELTAVYRGSGGAEADIQRYINELSPNASAAQKKDTIKNIAGLLNSRLEALQDQYQKGLGVGAQGYQFLDPKAEHTLTLINGGGTPPPPGGPIGPSGGGGGGPKLSPDQQAHEKAFLATNPTKEQYASFLAALQGGGAIDVDAAGKRLDALKAGAEYNPNIDEAAKVRQRIQQEDKLGAAESPVTTLAKQGATLNLSDEAAGIGNAAANVLTSPFTGNFDPAGSYDLGRDVERQRIADAREQLGYGALPIELVGGMAAAAPTSALAAVSELPALIRQGATGGAAGGALAGFGQGEGTSQSLTGAAVGGTGGAVVGALAPYAANRIAMRGVPRGMAPDVADAAKAEGVDLIRPMVDPSSRSDFGALESNIHSQPIIQAGTARVRGQIEDRALALGGGGEALEPSAAGSRLQVAGNRYITRTKGIKDRLYRRAELAAGDTRFVPQNAIDQLQADIQELSGNPKSNASTIQFLQDKLSDLSTPGGKTVAEIRNIREGLRGEISQKNLTMTNAERLANNALQAAGEDIAKAAPEAGRLYKRADAFYRERQVMVDDLKRAILGSPKDPLDPQKAFANIKSLMGESGNNRRLSAVMSHLEPTERQDIAATVAESLGRRAPDEPFSTSLFLSQTRKLSPSARRTLFGPDGAQSIDNLRLLAQRLEAGEKDINRSRSATVLERQGIRTAARSIIATLAGMGGTAVATGSTGLGLAGGAVAGGAMLGSAVRRVLSARAMVNPRVSMWLAQAADVSTPSQAKQAVKGLSLVISREPALARELTPIRDFLDQRVTQLLAAEPNNQDQQQR